MSAEKILIPDAIFDVPPLPTFEPVTGGSASPSSDLLKWDDVTPGERARLNAIDSFRRGTLLGATTGPQVAPDAGNQDDAANQQALSGPFAAPVLPPQEREKSLAALEKDRLDLARYELMSGAEGFGQTAAAFGGAIGGAIPSPENLIALPGRAGLAVTQFIARSGGGRIAQAAGVNAAGAALTNLAVDPIVQGINVGTNVQDKFSLERTAIGTAGGALIGGGLGAAGAALSGALARRSERKAVEGFLKSLTNDEPSIAPSQPAASAAVPQPSTRAAEIIPAEQADPPRLIGIEAPLPQHRVATADGASVEVRPVIVEARDLLASSDQGYDARFQPRDRERAASTLQIQDIVSKFDPQRLGISAEADRGAPIVGADRMVESGNGRVMAIRKVYEQDGDAAANYRGWLMSQGIDITGFDQPVLVRQRVTPMDDAQRAQFTRAANQEATLQMSGTERSASDAALIDADMLALIRNADDLGAASNTDFIRAFIRTLPQSQQGGLLQADGSISSSALSRVRNAVLSAAYGDSPIIARIVEATDDDAKSLTGALVAASPEFARLRAGVVSGAVDPNMDFTPAVTEAVRRVIDMRARGVKLKEFFAQVDAFDVVTDDVASIMRMMYRPDEVRAAGKDVVAERLTFIAREAQKVSGSQGLDLGIPSVSRADIIDIASRKGTRSDGTQGDLLSAGSRDGAGTANDGGTGQGRSADDGGDLLGGSGGGGDQGGQPELSGLRTSRTEARLARIIDPDLAAARLRSGDQLPNTQSRVPVAATAEAPPVKSPQTIGRELSEAMAIPLREKRFTLKGALGEYDYRDSVARVRQPADLQVVSHELGHALDQMLGKGVADNFAKKHTSLQSLDIWSDPAGAPDNREVFAEFIRLWVTNRAFLEKQHPSAYGEFADLIAGKAPDISRALDDAQATYQAFLSAPSSVALNSMVKVDRPVTLGDRVRKEGWMGTINSGLATMRRWILDEEDSLRLAVRELLRVRKDNTGKTVEFETAQDPYRLQKLAKNAAQGAIIDLDRGVIPHGQFKPQGPSLKGAIEVAMDGTGRWDEARMADFDTYLIARRGIGEWERFERGELERRPMAISKEDLIQAKTDLEAKYGDAFRNAAPMVHTFLRNTLKKSFDGGLISRETFEDALKIADYVPFYRDMGDPSKGSAARGQDPGDVRIVQQFKGSDRDILSPMQSIIKQSYRTNIAVAKNDVVSALARLADQAGPGSGAFVERIPASEMTAVRVDVEEAIISAATANGMSRSEAKQLAATTVAEVDGDAIATIFRAKQTGKRGEPIVFFREAGELQAIRLADGDFGQEVLNALVPAPAFARDTVIQMLAMPAQLIRTTATKNPAFIIAAFLRDQVEATIKVPGFVPFWTTFKGIADVTTRGEAATAFNAAGGIFGGESTAMLKPVINDGDVSQLTAPFSFRNLVIKINQWSEIAEAGTRVGVYKVAYDRGIKRGLSPTEAHLDAAWTGTDYLNFGQSGERTRSANQIIPFFNAALQGLYKTANTGVVPLVRLLRGDVVSTMDKRDVADAMRFWTVMSLLSVAGLMSRMSTLDDDRVNDAQPEVRAKNWLIPVNADLAESMAKAGFDIRGAVLHYPKPFELASTFSLGERAAEALMGDPRAAKGFAKDIYETFLPPLPWDIPAAKLPFELITGVSAFTKRDIVPERLARLEPTQQFTERTSYLAKQIGSVTGTSPIYIDHIFTSLTAGIGRDVTALINAAAPDQPAKGWDDTVITRRFVKNGWRGTQNSAEFWERMSPMTGKFQRAANTYDNFIKQGREGEAIQFLSSLKEEERAFVIMNKSSLKPEDKRLHPMNRASEAISVINAALRESASNNVMSIDGREKIDVSPIQRKVVNDALTRMREVEARNALVMMGVEGWKGRQLMDVKDDMAVLRQAAPEMAVEVAKRYAAAKIYSATELARAWPNVQKEVLRSGSAAQLLDMRFDVASAGYQFGDMIDNARIRRARVTRPQVAGSGIPIPR